MATVEILRSAMVPRDNDSPTTQSPVEISPGSELSPQEKEHLQRSNGKLSSPIRNERKVNIVNNKQWPQIPNGDSASHNDAPSLRFQPEKADGSFPFNAQPGAIGPAPTNELMNGSTLSRKRTNDAGSATPQDRRSVQFARDTTDADPGPIPLRKTKTLEADEHEDDVPPLKERQGSFFTKLIALATPTSSSHSRSASNNTGFGSPNVALSPQSERSEPSYTAEPSEAADADAEEDSEDGDGAGDLRPRRPRKSKRPALSSGESAPTTPTHKASRLASFIRDHQAQGSSSTRPPAARRATMSDVSENADERAGVSEDEGRDRIRAAWRRGIEGARNMSYAARKQNTDGDTPDGGRRPGNLRRFTGIGGLDSAHSPFRARAERQGSTSAQKWKQVKAGLKVLGQRRREERMRVDHQKSAQLMAELLAGAPAALFFASMYQRDEHGHRKIPVLLEQLMIRIPHSEHRVDKSGDRHLVFRIELEYGNGPARMQWAIRRSLQDFVNLHAKYKGAVAVDKFRHLRSDDKSKAKMPKFPKSAFPYARGARGLFEPLKDEEEDPEAPAIDGLDGEASATERPGLSKHKRRQSSIVPPRRASTGEIIPIGTDPSSLTARQRELYSERQRKKLETYLQQMIRWLIFRADSTRLCKFIELSALAIRLSAEGGSVGKQGLLRITERSNTRETRRPFTSAANSIRYFGERHSPKWFLVRHSYIVCVDGPELLNPYDVFLVDADFRTEKRKKPNTPQQYAAQDVARERAAKASQAPGGKHLIRLYNSERKLKLLARSERQWIQFQESINNMVAETVWAKKQRYGSFAPVRHNAWARWLVDGRDHMWQVSRAIDNAKDFVYIHDWWLSPELYTRRPAAISQKWRLDRLLQRKAQEGVKIFVIIYRNIESAIPIDSEYTKWSLLDLHENICIQRSPNQFRQNQFFWAHHEKLVVVDNMTAFVGGIDLCFGRWDDPCHSLTDDKLTGFELNTDLPRDSEHCQVWPGKDYSNPRVLDFYALDRPYEEMYDRTKVPRMPWHDISMQIVGQPARDIGRHFVQRWNYVLRSRIPSRPTPVLLPPPEYDTSELEAMGMAGTCQIQIVRSCSPWSIGTPNKVEHSIMNAYCDLIRNSDHFVYIENQFFISSCIVEGTQIHNKIGDALLERAIKAHDNGESWQACLIIPLMPGFQNSVDSQDGTSVRLIMQCQFRSICRGDASIFGRLRARSIAPEEYIRFYSLRQWGKIGPQKCLTTEQLYIHAKAMVVDDRTAIIGSANVNERSMLGFRDSEVCAVVTDTKMIPSFMGGKPYLVGEFAHTLRKRLQREHLGVDVDAIYRREQAVAEHDAQDAEMDRIYHHGRDDFPMPSQSTPVELTQHTLEVTLGGTDRKKEDPSVWAGTTQANSSPSLVAQMDGSNERKKGSADLAHDLDVAGYGPDNMKALVEAGDTGLTDSFVDSHGREVLLKKDAPDSKRLKSVDEQELRRRSESNARKADVPIRPPWPTERMDTLDLGLMPRSQLPELPAVDDTDIGGPALIRGFSSISGKYVDPLVKALRRPEIHEDCMTDPIVSGFYHDIWHTVAENNTKLFRQVFRCMPDSEVLDFKTYHKYNDYNDRFMQSQGLGATKPDAPKEAPEKSGPPGSAGTDVTNALAEKTVEKMARSKTMLGGLVDKLRPGSKTSEMTMADEMREKEDQIQRAGSPGSPGSGASSVPTAVPTPDIRPLDEKDAAKQTDGTYERPLTLCPPASNDGNASFTRQRTVTYSDSVSHGPETTATQSTQSEKVERTASQKRRRRGTTRSSARTQGMEEVLSKDEAEELLKLVQGNLVLWPYDWLEKEERGGNWLYPIDQIAPLEIYD